MPNDPEPTISSPSASENEDAEDIEHPKDESSSQQNRLGSGRKFTDTQRIYILMALSEARGRLYIPAKATRITEKIYTEACNILDNNWADKTGLEGRHPNRKSVRTLWKRFVSTGTLARKGGGRKKSNIDAELIEILKKEEQSEEPFSLRKIASMMPEDRRVSAVTIARRLADLKKPQRTTGTQRMETPVKNVPQKKQPNKPKKVQQSKQRQPKPLQQQSQPGEGQQSRVNQQPEQSHIQIEQEQAQFQELRPQKKEYPSETEHQLVHQQNEHNQYQQTPHQLQHQQPQTPTQYRNPPPQLQLQLPVGQNQLRSTNTHNVDNRHNNEFTIQLSFVPDDKLTVVDGK